MHPYFKSLSSLRLSHHISRAVNENIIVQDSAGREDVTFEHTMLQENIHKCKMNSYLEVAMSLMNH